MTDAQRIEDLEGALAWALTYISGGAEPVDGEQRENYTGAERVCWPDEPENWSPEDYTPRRGPAEQLWKMVDVLYHQGKDEEYIAEFIGLHRRTVVVRSDQLESTIKGQGPVFLVMKGETVHEITGQAADRLQDEALRIGIRLHYTAACRMAHAALSPLECARGGVDGHCVHWDDGELPCCRCGAPPLPEDTMVEQGMKEGPFLGPLVHEPMPVLPEKPYLGPPIRRPEDGLAAVPTLGPLISGSTLREIGPAPKARAKPRLSPTEAAERATELAERYAAALEQISAALPKAVNVGRVEHKAAVTRIRTIIAGLQS
jgi:hypothetical protein